MSIAGLSGDEVQSVGAALQSSKDLGNRDDVELQWAMKASSHADIYFNIITSVDPSSLRLTSIDDEIYDKFRTEFRDFQVNNIDVKELKSSDAKLKWRKYCESFKDFEDYNFGTLLRIDCKKDYSEINTIFALRIQFLAIEITRNREGFNVELKHTKGKTEETEKS